MTSFSLTRTSANLFLLLIAVLCFARCDQGVNEVLLDPQDNDRKASEDALLSVTIDENRLSFEGYAQFKSFIDQLKLKDLSELGGFESQIGFVSLRTHTEQLTRSESGVPHSDLKVIRDPFFATALNKNGEIRIGGQVLKVTRDYVYIADVANADALSQVALRQDDFKVNRKLQLLSNIRVHAIERSVSQLGTQSAGKVSTDLEPTCESELENGNVLSGEVWVENVYAMGGSAGISTSGSGQSVMLALHAVYDLTALGYSDFNENERGILGEYEGSYSDYISGSPAYYLDHVIATESGRVALVGSVSGNHSGDFITGEGSGGSPNVQTTSCNTYTYGSVPPPPVGRDDDDDLCDENGNGNIRSDDQGEYDVYEECEDDEDDDDDDDDDGY